MLTFATDTPLEPAIKYVASPALTAKRALIRQSIHDDVTSSKDPLVPANYVVRVILLVADSLTQTTNALLDLCPANLTATVIK